MRASWTTKQILNGRDLDLFTSPDMASTNTIPRFLLPRAGTIWRTQVSHPTNPSLFIRNASKSSKKSSKPSKPSKPLVLEKPAKFNPPSHGARLRKEAPRYPGPQLSAEEKAAQAAKKYPSMMPPEGTFMHWFINNRSIHLWITMVLLPCFKEHFPLANSDVGHIGIYGCFCMGYEFQEE